jgi:hypothetical protein
MSHISKHEVVRGGTTQEVEIEWTVSKGIGTQFEVTSLIAYDEHGNAFAFTADELRAIENEILVRVEADPMEYEA